MSHDKADHSSETRIGHRQSLTKFVFALFKQYRSQSPKLSYPVQGNADFWTICKLNVEPTSVDAVK